MRKVIPLTVATCGGVGVLIAAVLLLMFRLPESIRAETPVRAEGNIAATTIGTTFTYQGMLSSTAGPSNGSFDFTFTLYNALTGGVQIGSTLTKSGVSVQNGFFAVDLDFGSVFTGELRYLELAVRQENTSAFTTLTPRQVITPAPYALWAANADTAKGRETWSIGEVVANRQTGIIDQGTRFYSSSMMGQQRTFNNFPPPPTPKVVDSVSFFVGSRTGTYTDTLTLYVEVRDYDGNLQHTISATTIDLKTALMRQWVTVPLVSDATQLSVQPGEYLGVRVELGGALAGNLEVYMAFQAQVHDLQ